MSNEKNLSRALGRFGEEASSNLPSAKSLSSQSTASDSSPSWGKSVFVPGIEKSATPPGPPERSSSPPRPSIPVLGQEAYRPPSPPSLARETLSTKSEQKESDDPLKDEDKYRPPSPPQLSSKAQSKERDSTSKNEDKSPYRPPSPPRRSSRAQTKERNSSPLDEDKSVYRPPSPPRRSSRAQSKERNSTPKNEDKSAYRPPSPPRRSSRTQSKETESSLNKNEDKSAYRPPSPPRRSSRTQSKSPSRRSSRAQSKESKSKSSRKSKVSSSYRPPSPLADDTQRSDDSSPSPPPKRSSKSSRKSSKSDMPRRRPSSVSTGSNDEDESKRVSSRKSKSSEKDKEKSARVASARWEEPSTSANDNRGSSLLQMQEETKSAKPPSRESKEQSSSKRSPKTVTSKSYSERWEPTQVSVPRKSNSHGGSTRRVSGSNTSELEKMARAAKSKLESRGSGDSLSSHDDDPRSRLSKDTSKRSPKSSSEPRKTSSGASSRRSRTDKSGSPRRVNSDNASDLEKMARVASSMRELSQKQAAKDAGSSSDEPSAAVHSPSPAPSITPPARPAETTETSVKPSLKNSRASSPDMSDKKKSAQVAWNTNLFVVDTPPGSPRSGIYDYSSSPSTDSSPPRRSLSARRPPRPLSSRRRKESLIEDKKKRDTRWKWNQELVRKSFKPYRVMLSDQDDLLPDDDEFHVIEEKDNAVDKEFANVRDAMLEDGDLNEREVAAFFEGFALFNIKVGSLQSQLKSLKAITRVSDERQQQLRSFRAAKAKRSQSDVFSKSMSEMGVYMADEAVEDVLTKLPQRSRSVARSNRVLPGKTIAVEEAEDDKAASDTSDDVPPRMFGESLRMLSIKKVQAEHDTNEEVRKLLKELEAADKKQKKLEKQLQQAGVLIAEDIPYEEAKDQVERIAKRMAEIGSSEVTRPDKEEQAKLREEYFKLEQDMEKYNNALMLTDEYAEEQEELEQKWEDDHLEENMEALKKLRRHMPVEVKSMSEAELNSRPTPNGKVLPKPIAKRFKRTNVLQLIRTDPEDLVRMHPSTLENLRVTGMTLTERRAIYAHIREVGPKWKAMQAEKMTERKWTWFKMMKQNFKENLDQYEYHVEQYGPPGSHPYATRDNPKEGCPLLGKQCPLKADKMVDYDDDYGYPDEAVYEVSSVRKADKEDPGAKAKREAMELARDKKANERSIGLKKHYKGKVLQVSLANGSCESMDEVLDNIEARQSKWIEDRVAHEGGTVTDEMKSKELTAFTDALNELKLAVLTFAERSGMQLTGKKDANAGQPDIRSPIELGLCEEVCEAAIDFFDGIQERMKELEAKDGRLKSTIEQLKDLLDELHERNLATLKELECERPAPSRKHKTRAELTKEAKAKAKAANSESVAVSEEDHGPLAAAMGGRGDLMSAIAGRGGRGAGGGRGNLMAAIAGRGGRGGAGGRGDPGGRGDLMAAIAGRGRGDAGGRGDLMAAIAGRGGRGAGGRGDPGGRGDLMAAIAGRGRGGATGGRGNAGGRGDLMAAIAGRGRGGAAGGRGDSGGRGAELAAIAARGGRGDGGEGRGDSGGRGNLMAAIAARGKVE